MKIWSSKSGEATELGGITDQFCEPEKTRTQISGFSISALSVPNLFSHKLELEQKPLLVNNILQLYIS